MIGGVPERAGPQIATNLAGPAVNLLLCVGLGTTLLLAGLGSEILAALPMIGHRFGHGPPSFAWWLVSYAFGVNLLNMLFNLIPAWPLDGGKVLVWTLAGPFRYGYRRAAMIGTAMGMGFAVLLGMAGLVLFVPMLVLLAIFAWVACRWERSRITASGGFIEADVFGYDFSGGYTTLDASGPDAPSRRARAPRERRPWFWARWRAERAERERERAMSEELAVRARVDALLEKISTGGMGALSMDEKEFLKDASRRYGG
jgi:hypothetical protein